MSVIETTKSLGELVTEHPVLARELERIGLDYCCGGRRSLADACETAGLNAYAVASELGALSVMGVPAAWAKLGAVDLVDHIVATHHRYLWSEMPRLAELAAKVASVHGGRRPELLEVQRLLDAIVGDLEPHLTKEERVLFPMISELAASTTVPEFHCGTLANPISVMLREHDQVGELLEDLRRETNGYNVPNDGCASYRSLYDGLAQLESDTHLHVHKENNVLFPMVLRLEQQRARG
jgi:regulator of cell morphogenesis and NO signaling